ncbi:spermatogenesis-associated protein 20 [Galendromus occidentalis]|uniref:Spermatogenesis-associated protein 20 n=1 Tax=Galendromus occidentalis TaxID=34638 RepID=A0AAJ6QVZ1_9ACAR|nr:spermatogenesis-associated protein 20 [Galendromus occidentalis]
MAFGGSPVNRLVNERSPYLLQHAHNPVAWFSWEDEAFEAARRDNKLIFLSIGYSTCHWCHVMERESFENEEVAKILNDRYVSIKVDREERPDIDKIYMTYVQVTSGHSGWPLSVWLTPELKPIFGGTYFPPEDNQYGLAGFKTILLMLDDKWHSSKNEKIKADSDRITAMLARASNLRENLEAAESFQPSQCIKDCSLILQKHLIGFVKEPRFPQCVNGNFYMNLFHFQNNRMGVDIVERQLKEMATGGIHDHLGGGFHRYTVDAAWQVPHFEKMLYDQAQILALYCSYLRMPGIKPEIASFFGGVATGIADYVMRDLSHPQGGFYSAEDADSLESFDSSDHKKEGAFYVWTMAEIQKILSKKEAKVFCEFFGVDEQGNVDPHHDAQGELLNQNTLFYRYPDSYDQNINDMAKVIDLEDGDPLDEILESAKRKLLQRRLESRPRPHLDNKIVSAWNGLMIAALAKASVVLKRPAYAERALKAVDFIRANLFDRENQRLYRSAYTEGEGDAARVEQLEKPIPGVLEDYAFVISGLLQLYDATLDEQLLLFAKILQDSQNRQFWDETNGGYFLFSGGGSNIIYVLKDDHDGAEPSANSVSIANLIRLYHIFDHEPYRTKANKTVKLFAERLSKVPIALPEMVSSLMYLVEPPTKIILSAEDDEISDFKRVCDEEARGFSIVFAARSVSELGFTKEQYPAVNGEVTAYVCKDLSCLPPINDIDDLRRELQR